jgi:hypothetical protein
MMEDIKIDVKDLNNFIEKSLKEKNPVAYNYAKYLEEQIKNMEDELNKIKPKISSNDILNHFHNNTHGDNSHIINNQDTVVSNISTNATVIQNATIENFGTKE